MQVVVENISDDGQDIQSPQAAARSDSVAHLALANRFNLSSPSKEEEGKLAEIWAHAKTMARTEDIQDVIWEVMHLENVLGSPRLGESRLDRLYRYTKLKRQEAQIQSELKNVSLGRGI
jgi:hypothetical protein